MKPKQVVHIDLAPDNTILNDLVTLLESTNRSLRSQLPDLDHLNKILDRANNIIQSEVEKTRLNGFNANPARVTCIDVSKCFSADGSCFILVEVSDANCGKLNNWLANELKEFNTPNCPIIVKSEW